VNAGTRRHFSCCAKNHAATTTTTSLLEHSTVVDSVNVTTSHKMIVRGVPVAKIPSLRGVASDGFYLECSVTSGGSTTGHGIKDPSGGAYVKLHGYRWPTGTISV
jgi:sulfopyruvate decarboxylase TPP-binding subunit